MYDVLDLVNEGQQTTTITWQREMHIQTDKSNDCQTLWLLKTKPNPNWVTCRDDEIVNYYRIE